VFWRLRHRQADAVLIDRNVELVKSLGLGDRDQLLITDLLRVDKEDLRGELKRGFDVVLLDPPWYVDHTLSWISCALAILRPGGKLILTLFPELVRPTALEEREHLKKVLESFGAIQSLPFDAFYSTPTFEHETLGAFGLADLGQWRSGSLISLTVSKPGKPLSVPFPPEAKWKRVRLGSQVVAVRSSNDETRAALPLRFSPPESDGSFLLKSVSARDPVRRGITVWTSRNRALIASQGEGHVLPFLQKLEKGQKPVEALAGSDPLSRDELRLLSGLVGW